MLYMLSNNAIYNHAKGPILVMWLCSLLTQNQSLYSATWEILDVEEENECQL